MIGMYGYLVAVSCAAIGEQQLVARAKERMTPEHFAEWNKERVSAARHRELVRAIENSRPRGIGLFW